MHHMTANFSPTAQEERKQLCYGVWGVVGSTKRWPEVVNIWEEDGFDGMATSFRTSSTTPPCRTRAGEMVGQSRGVPLEWIDRILAPAPWTRTIDQLCTDGVTGETYAHERSWSHWCAGRDFLGSSTGGRPVYQVRLGDGRSLGDVDGGRLRVLASCGPFPPGSTGPSSRRRSAPHRGPVDWRDHACERPPRSVRFLLVDSPLVPLPNRPPAGPIRPDGLGGMRTSTGRTRLRCPVEGGIMSHSRGENKMTKRRRGGDW